MGGQGGVAGVVCASLAVGSLCEVVADALDALARFLLGIAMLRLELVLEADGGGERVDA